MVFNLNLVIPIKLIEINKKHSLTIEFTKSLILSSLFHQIVGSDKTQYRSPNKKDFFLRGRKSDS